MLKNTNDRLLEDLEEVRSCCNERKSLVQRYLQNPFSLKWTKLAALVQAALEPSQPEPLENYQYEQHKPDRIQEQYSYPCFTDRVDPSLYYSIFFPHNRF